MAIEKHGDGGFTLTGVDTKVFQYVRVAHALALEINIPGMKVARGGSLMLLAASYCGSSKRTKKGVLRDYIAWMKKQVPGWEPSESVAKAAAK